MRRKANISALVVVIILLLLVVGCGRVEFPILDEDKCIGCRECLSVCSYDAIHFEDGKPIIDVDKCTGCGECAQICPTGALIMP